MSDNIVEILPFLGIIVIGCASFYFCCKKIKLLQNEIINEIIIENIEEEIEEIEIPPPYKLTDEPPIYHSV